MADPGPVIASGSPTGRSAPSAGHGAGASRVRPEIQALRALAVLLVVVFHLYPNRVPGGYVGVDVFFVISGFLITSHLAREILDTGRVRLARFYSRRIRRLLPAAYLVLTITLVVGLAFGNTADREVLLRDTLGSALYSVNWVLAASSVDYFAAESAVSPVQHYWSLAVEEQFYLVWPLILLLAWIPRRKSVLIAAMSVVFVTCLAFSVAGAALFPTVAYFATPAHGWEFAAGALLALLRPASPAKAGWLPSGVAWAGWAAIVASAFLFDGSTPFPGWVALLPVVGTLAVIGAGEPRAAWAPTRIARLRPVQFVGDVSYSFYLWHFPPIVLLPAILDRPLGTLDKVLIFVACIVLAWLTKRFVEDPVRTWPRLQPSRVTFAVATGTTLVLVLATAVPTIALGRGYVASAQLVVDEVTEVLDGPGVPLDSCLGAMSTVPGATCPSTHTPLPDYGPEFASLDNFDTWSERIGRADPYFIPECRTVPDTGISECWHHSGVEDAFTVAIIGDSHAGQWLPAILLLGQQNGWDVIRYRESGCRLALGVYDSTTEHGLDCKAWKDEIVPYIKDADWIDLVTTSAAVNGIYLGKSDPPPLEDFEDGFLRVWLPWLESGKHLLVMGDGPSYGDPVPACVEDHLDEESPCSVARSAVDVPDPLPLAAARVDDPAFGYFDLMSIVCDDETCHPVVGGLIAQKDSGHIAASFMATVAPLLAPTMRDLVPEAFAGPR